MKVPWELLLIVAILVVAAAAVQQVRPQQPPPSPPDLASDATTPGGAKALYLWLQSLGYRVERLENRDYRPDEATEVLLILAPSMTIDKDYIDAIRRWVEDGGTLILVGEDALPMPRLPTGGPAMGNSVLPPVLREFGMALRFLTTTKTEAAPTQPLLLRPVVGKVRVETSTYVTGPADMVPHLGDADRPVAAGLAVGKGQVYVLASAFALSNEGLGEADNAALLLNWLPGPGRAGTVAFDEIHHGRSEARSFTYVVLHEPWGWAVIYGMGITFIYLVLDGRPFGRAVPDIVDSRRVAAEYVVSLAALLRRGGKGNWVARHYEHTLRQRLVAACGLDPALDSKAVAERVDKLDRLGDGIEGRAASRVLLELSDAANSGVAEGRLVRLAGEADRMINACSGRRT